MEDYYTKWKTRWDKLLNDIEPNMITEEKFKTMKEEVFAIKTEMQTALANALSVDEIDKVYGEIDQFTHDCWANHSFIAPSTGEKTNISQSVYNDLQRTYLIYKREFFLPEVYNWMNNLSIPMNKWGETIHSNDKEEINKKMSEDLDKFETIIRNIKNPNELILTVSLYTDILERMHFSFSDDPFDGLYFSEQHEIIKEALCNRAKELLNIQDVEIQFTNVENFHIMVLDPATGERREYKPSFLDRFAPPLRAAQQNVAQQQVNTPSANTQATSAQTANAQPTNTQATSAQTANAQPTNTQATSAQTANAQPTNTQATSAQTANAQPTNTQATSAQTTNTQATNTQTTNTPPTNTTPPNGGSNGQIPDIELEDLSDLDNIQSSINDVINNPNMGVNALIDEYNEAKNKVDEILNEQIIKMMKEEDFVHNESFWEHYEKNSPNYNSSIIDDSDKEAWLKSMSGKDGRKDRIRIASECTRQGRDGWVEKVSDAEDEKSRKKKEIEDVGTRILQRLDNILKDFDAKIKRHEDNIKANMSNIDREIQRINGKIDALDKEKSEYQKAYQKSNKKDQHEYNQDIAEFERKIKEEKEKKEQYEKAKKRLEQNKKELQSKKEQRNKYDMLIQDEKRKFAQKLQNETNVEIQFDKSTYIKSTEENLPSNAPATATNGNRTTQIDIRKPTEIVAAQNIDLKHASTSEIMEMIDSKEGYGELLEAAREAGHFSRRVVRKEMEKRLEDLLREESGNTVKIGDARISKKDLYNLKKIKDETQINALIDRIKEYTKQYDKVQGYEQQKIDNEMQIFKLAVLLTETKTTHFDRWRHNHWPNFMKKSTSRVQDFGNDLRELARKVEDRSKFQESTKDRVFKKLGYELDPKTTKKTSLDRSGIKPIKQQGRDR